MKQLFRILIPALLTAVACLVSCKPSKDTVEVSSIQLDKTSLELRAGDNAALKATVLPENAKDKTVVWSSSNVAVAEVTQGGVVTAIAEGNAQITAAVGEKEAVCAVSVLKSGVQTVTVTPDNIEITKNETAVLSAKVTPEDAEYDAVEWMSSDESVVTVDDSGKITGIAAGKATIIAKVGLQGGVCDVTVTGISAESVTVEPASVTLNVSENIVLTATVMPDNADNKAITWTSSDEKVATVNADGKVVAKAGGSAVIKATCGTAEGTSEITVIGKPKIGDYYYSDGSYSTNLDKDKTPIGIVFYAKDPGKQDATLRKDHPECTHGLVVSIDGEKLSRWQSNYEAYDNTVNNWVMANTQYETILVGYGKESTDRINHIVGYNNTKAIEAFNAAPENAGWPVDIVMDLDEYRKNVPAPTASSDWYVPSPKELMLLCFGETDKNIRDILNTGGQWTSIYTEMREKINRRLETLENALILQGADLPAAYWSTGEITKKYAVDCAFFMGNIGDWEKNGFYETNFRVRYILAF